MLPHTNYEVTDLEKKNGLLWNVFTETGDIEVYLEYTKRKKEDKKCPEKALKRKQ